MKRRYNDWSVSYSNRVWQNIKAALLLLIPMAGLIVTCDALGIGKKCYDCETSRIGIGKTTVVEVCGYDSMVDYRKKNSGQKGDILYNTICKRK